MLDLHENFILDKKLNRIITPKIKQVSNYPCKTGHFAAFLLD